MKTRDFRFTKGTAGRTKFARPPTSGIRYFKQLTSFWQHKNTHLHTSVDKNLLQGACHLKDLKGTGANVSAAVDLFLSVVQQKEKVESFQTFT